MRDQRSLHFVRRDPRSADLEHVVGAPADAIEAVRIAHVFVTGTRPFALEGAARLFALVPIAVGRRRPTDAELADLALRHFAAIVVDQPRLIARHRYARRPVTDLAGIIAEEDVQHLGRADTIVDIDAEALLPFKPDMLGQRFARRDAHAQAHRAIPLGAGRVRDHRGV